MIKINLSDVLNEEQFYVMDISRELGIDVRAVRHDIATNTCFEKADLLGWNSERVVKAVFLGGRGKLYGFICPELGTREKPLYFDKKVLGGILGYTKKQMTRFHNSCCPEGMERGTCTPFVFEDAFEDIGYGMPVEKIFVHDIPKLGYKIVDISIGGCGDVAHKVSLHLPYYTIYDILDKKFGRRIQKRDLLINKI